MSFSNLRSFLEKLKQEGELREISAEVDPCLELAEIHRRIIAEGGPALLFTKVRGSRFPVATNLFGTARRVDFAFGDEPVNFVKQVASLPHELLPPTLGRLWEKRKFFSKALKIGLKELKPGKDFELQTPANLDLLPILTSWPGDGGPFITLPLVYTEHPDFKGKSLGMHNLGMYRLQKFDAQTTGLHMQIAKGGGFHLSRAKELKQALPVNVFLGGPPAAILAAISPLPENVPELLLASLALNKKLPLARHKAAALPFLAEAEFVLIGEAQPEERRAEGPFGDHYGYYSQIHNFPVLRLKSILARKDSIYPATIVGKPRQEDFFIGDYLQKLLSPLFPLVMPAVLDLWSYGETGYHSLAAAVVKERYKRESLVSAFRILGEGQLSLTKFLLLLDKPMDLTDFPKVLEHILARCDLKRDLYIFANSSMDTLDYSGPALSEGSKGVLMGIGEPRRELARSLKGSLPGFLKAAKVFCPGCLLLSGASYEEDPELARKVSQSAELDNFMLIVLVDRVEEAASSSAAFLWTSFTRFEPARDLYASKVELRNYHPELSPPLVLDARMKPWYPDEVEVSPETKQLVDKRWKEY